MNIVHYTSVKIDFYSLYFSMKINLSIIIASIYLVNLFKCSYLSEQIYIYEFPQLNYKYISKSLLYQLF